MGKKYSIYAFDYPYKGYYKCWKNTSFFIVAVCYFFIWSVKYFGVNLEKRGNHE